MGLVFLLVCYSPWMCKALLNWPQFKITWYDVLNPSGKGSLKQLCANNNNVIVCTHTLEHNNSTQLFPSLKAFSRPNLPRLCNQAMHKFDFPRNMSCPRQSLGTTRLDSSVVSISGFFSILCCFQYSGIYSSYFSCFPIFLVNSKWKIIKWFDFDLI